MTTSHPPAAVWAVVLAVGALTFAIRHSFVYLFGRVETVPPRVAAALRYVPPAVLAALVFPALVGEASLVTDRTLAGAAAAVAAWYTGDTLATIAVGMGALWLLRFVA
ncbi:MAG: AzlD domain-containing protein [Haloferacaceae archaeon]